MSDDNKTATAKKGFLSLPFLRDILIVVAIAIAGWKLSRAELKIDLAAFAFTDLLALLLALFSVWLSVAFYFKASEASNQFYDNTYRFTKEMSEMLGRIEAGFGEKLRHLDEGYSGIRERFDRMPHYTNVTNADVKKEEDEVKQKEKEQQALIEDLAQKAKLAEHEKKALFENLAQKSEALEQARIELRRLKRSSQSSSEETQERRVVLRYIVSKIADAYSGEAPVGELNTKDIRKLFSTIFPKLPREAVRDLRRFDIIDDKEELTRESAIHILIQLRKI